MYLTLSAVTTEQFFVRWCARKLRQDRHSWCSSTFLWWHMDGTPVAIHDRIFWDVTIFSSVLLCGQLLVQLTGNLTVNFRFLINAETAHRLIGSWPSWLHRLERTSRGIGFSSDDDGGFQIFKSRASTVRMPANPIGRLVPSETNIGEKDKMLSFGQLIEIIMSRPKQRRRLYNYSLLSLWSSSFWVLPGPNGLSVRNFRRARDKVLICWHVD